MYNVNDNAAFSAMQRTYDAQMPPDEDERTDEQIAEDERANAAWAEAQYDDNYHGE